MNKKMNQCYQDILRILMQIYNCEACMKEYDEMKVENKRNYEESCMILNKWRIMENPTTSKGQ